MTTPLQTFTRLVCAFSLLAASAIDSVTRDDTGRLSLRLKGHTDTLAVSRLFAHLFKAM